MQKAVIVTDLGYGDGGKGSIVDYYTRFHRAHTVVRYNGGAQAAHNVVLPDGRHHTFAQFGSGTLAGARTYLSKHMLIDPEAMLNEARQLSDRFSIQDPLRLVYIDRDAIIVTPYHRAANQLKELERGDKRHGSCGMGIGETMLSACRWPETIIRASDLQDLDELSSKLRMLQTYEMQDFMGTTVEGEYAERALATLHRPAGQIVSLYHAFADAVRIVPDDFLLTILNDGVVIFEGAQGVLLDEWYGFHPYTTWSTTTSANALNLLGQSWYSGEVTRVGVLRPYMTRHGAGPLVTENPDLSLRLPDKYNINGQWQRAFRVGWLDLIALRYALKVNGPVDVLAVTNLDRLIDLPELKVCRQYNYQHDLIDELTPNPVREDLVGYQSKLTSRLFSCRPQLTAIKHTEIIPCIELELGLRVAVASYGPTYEDKGLPTRIA